MRSFNSGSLCTSSLLINVIMFKLRPATKKAIPIPITFTAPGQYREWKLEAISAVDSSEYIYGGHLAQNMKSIA